MLAPKRKPGLSLDVSYTEHNTLNMISEGAKFGIIQDTIDALYRLFHLFDRVVG